MAYYILTEACICCGSCAAVCPVDAIHEKAEAYEISDDCVECGTCVTVCPIENILSTEVSKETRNMRVMPETLPIRT